MLQSLHKSNTVATAANALFQYNISTIGNFDVGHENMVCLDCMEW